MSPITELTKHYDSKEFKNLSECGSKDKTIAKIFDQVVKMMDEMKKIVAEVEKSKTSPKAQHAAQMFELVTKMTKITGTKAFHSYMVKNCPEQVVDQHVAASKINAGIVGKTAAQFKTIARFQKK